MLVVSGVEDPRSAAAVGARAVLPKPVQRHQVLEVVRRLFGEDTTRTPYLLVVDDDPKAVRVVTNYLADLPLEVGAVHGGREALESIAHRRPDLVILDLMMPGMSGFEVLAELGGTPETADLPVVVLSAKDLSSAERATLGKSARAVLGKATTGRGELLEQVRALLGPTTARRE
jgi:CheY-like chemotaxis protein